MDPAKLRAWWWHRQGLDGSCAGLAAAEVLERTGWVRGVGAAAPYLALFARAGVSREQADADAAALRIHELPSARGCTYVLPAAHFALGLRAGRGFADAAEVRSAARAGVTAEELAALRKKVLSELKKGPRDPSELREATGARSLGELGKKLGISTPIPVVLGELQQTGAIRRVPVSGRLDQQVYRYQLWNLAEWKNSAGDVYTELARLYFRWTGPATLKEFQWFSGLGVKASHGVAAPLALADISDGRLLDPALRDAWEKFKRPAEPSYALVPSIDGISLLRRDLASLLPDEAARVASLRGVADLPHHGIFDRGSLIGLWEYDPGEKELVWMTFGGKADKALLAAISRTEAFVRDQLGDARAMSLDSPKSRASRIEAIRKARI